MALIVQKFGGTSVANLERIRAVAQRAKETVAQGHQLVIVVSAKSGVTNRLVDEAKALHPTPDKREMDVLLSVGEQETIALTAIALQAIGIPAVSRTGGQARVITDRSHTKARISSIDGAEMHERLKEGKVIVVAGFQGVTEDGEITTLGRGGSDLSAIAMAAALKADVCQIFTDVDGVYTADPRIVPNARKIPVLSYEEMLELAGSGSKVMQSRSVEFSSKWGVIFEVRSSFNNNPGTIVKAESQDMEKVVVRGVALDKNQTKIAISDLPDQPGTAAKIFSTLAKAGVNVDMIVQNVGRAGIVNQTVTVPTDEAYIAEKAINELMVDLKGRITACDRVAKVSAVGVGMRSHSGVAATMFEALAKAGIAVQLISTSEIKISVAIDPSRADEACRVVHDAFQLGEG